MQDVANGVSTQRLYQNVNVVWHYHERIDQISLLIKMGENDGLEDRRPSQAGSLTSDCPRRAPYPASYFLGRSVGYCARTICLSSSVRRPRRSMYPSRTPVRCRKFAPRSESRVSSVASR